MTVPEQLETRERTTRLIVLVLTAVFVKQMAWVIWIPPGAIVSEIDHYRVAETIRLAGRFVHDRAAYTGKDVSLMEDYAEFQNDRLPLRSAANRRSLDHVLHSGAPEHVLVRYQGGDRSAANAPGYYVLLGRCQALLGLVDVRWRWIMLRVLNTIFLLTAALFTYAAARVFFPIHRLPAVAGAMVVGFGPWAGLGGSLIGPEPLAAALWAPWLWQVGRTLRRQNPWSLLWLSLIAFALSSVGGTGFLAALCTLVLALFVMRKQQPLQMVPFVAGSLVALACVAFWIYRFLRMGAASSSVPATVSDVVFGSTGFAVNQPPGWIGVLNVAIGVLVLGGVIAALTQRATTWWIPSVALGLIIVFLAFRSVLAGHSSGLLSMSPAVGLGAAAGVLGIRRRRWYGMLVMAAALVISDLGLLTWWIQKAWS